MALQNCYYPLVMQSVLVGLIAGETGTRNAHTSSSVADFLAILSECGSLQAAVCLPLFRHLKAVKCQKDLCKNQNASLSVVRVRNPWTGY